MGRAETSGDEADICVEPLRERPIEILGSIADDRDALRLEPQPESLGGEERPVAVLAFAANELAARDDDRRPGARQDEAGTMRRDVTVNAVPSGKVLAVPVEAHEDVLGLGEDELEPARLELLPLALLERPRVEEPPGRGALANLHPRAAAVRPHDEPRAALRGCRLHGGFCPSRVEVRHALALGPAEAPGRDHECGDDRRCRAAPARRSSTHVETGLGRVAAARAGRGRDVVVADREARVVLVDERLAVETERLRIRAQEAPHVRRRGKDLELLVLERAQVLRANLRALFELWEVELLTGAGLAEAGTDVEHEGGL